MRISIRVKWMLMLLGIVSSVLLCMLVLNATLMKNYYTRMKEQALKDCYARITEMDLDDSETVYMLEAIEENESMQILIIDDAGRVYFCNSQVKDTLFLPVDGQNGDETGVMWFNDWLLRNDSDGEPSIDIFTTQPAFGHRYNNELGVSYLSLYSKTVMPWNQRYHTFYIIINTSMTAMEDAIKIFNRFLFIICGIALLIGAVVIFFLIGRMVKPIVMVSNTASRVSKLDFSRKIELTSNDELGDLASSINHMSDQLESKIAELRHANRQLRQELKHKERVDEMRRDFISDVSHELKTPLAIILGYCEGLQLNVNSDDREYYCSVIEDEAMRMSRLASRLLNLAELESGELEPDMMPFDIGEMARSKIEKLSYLLDERSISHECSCEGGMCVYGAPDRIEEVFDNILTNAKNHTPDGGEIKVSLRDEGENVRCTIFNSGSHIPEESLDKIWESFYKVDKARTRAYGGSGLGLRIVSTILQAHDAQFGAGNTEEGVEFYFTLRKCEETTGDEFDERDDQSDNGSQEQQGI